MDILEGIRIPKAEPFFIKQPVPAKKMGNKKDSRSCIKKAIW